MIRKAIIIILMTLSLAAICYAQYNHSKYGVDMYGSAAIGAGRGKGKLGVGVGVEQ